MKNVLFSLPHLIGKLFSVLIVITCMVSQSKAQGSWTSGSVTGYTGAYGAGSALIGNKIYVFGGAVAGGTLIVNNSMFIYDAGTDTWTKPTTSGNFTARERFVTAYVNGKIYTIWGDTSYTTGGVSNAFEVFDPATLTWSKVNAIGSATPRRSAGSVVYNGKIYIIGGIDGANNYKSVDIFDPATNTWSNLVTTGTFTGRMGLSACLYNGKIYTFGGGLISGSVTTHLDILEILDLSTNVWSAPGKSGFFVARSGLETALLDNKIYTIGGTNYTGTSGFVVNAFEIFDPATNSFITPVTTGALSKHNYPAVEVVNNKIYVLGGSTGYAGSYDVNEIYNPSSVNINNEVNSEYGIQVFPNPTQGILNVECSMVNGKDIKIQVLNSLGQIVMEENAIQHSLPIAIGINIQHLPDGLYLVKVLNNNTLIATQKIIKN